jgi:4-alpha-glucanotransferase
MTALLELMGRSDAAIVLVALEDLWLETAAQNTPGTRVAENWRRPAAHAIDELAGVPGLVETLRRLDAARGGS